MPGIYPVFFDKSSENRNFFLFFRMDPESRQNESMFSRTMAKAMTKIATVSTIPSAIS